MLTGNQKIRLVYMKEGITFPLNVLNCFSVPKGLNIPEDLISFLTQVT